MPTPLEAAWLEHYLEALPERCSRVQVRETQLAFYAGIRAAFMILAERDQLQPSRIADLVVEWVERVEDVLQGEE